MWRMIHTYPGPVLRCVAWMGQEDVYSLQITIADRIIQCTFWSLFKYWQYQQALNQNVAYSNWSYWELFAGHATTLTASISTSIKGWSTKACNTTCCPNRAALVNGISLIVSQLLTTSPRVHIFMIDRAPAVSASSIDLYAKLPLSPGGRKT